MSSAIIQIYSTGPLGRSFSTTYRLPLMLFVFCFALKTGGSTWSVSMSVFLFRL
jgi:hypothetical protein